MGDGGSYAGKVGVALAAGCSVAACVVAAAMAGRMVRRRMGWWRVIRALEEFEQGCSTPVGRLRQVVDAMAVEMHAGLASEGGSKLKMLLTYISNLPTGKENGVYYALDLGGTTFRILRVMLDGQRSSVITHDVESHPIPQNLTTSEDLFDFIAESLKNFVESGGSTSEPSPQKELGFTFSFPVKQTSSSSGTLIKWTKGLSFEDMVGKDVTQCLHQAMSRKGLDMRVAALINDTVGTLALGHYNDEDTVAAVIFGTGTNACYLERSDAIIKSQGLLPTSGDMVVNVEWGSFFTSHLPRTSYDVDLDSDSLNPNDQFFEKMISGMFLGDIVRRVILKMSQESDIFGPDSSKLRVPFILRTPMIAAMHEDNSPELSEVARILQETFEIEVPLVVRKLVVKVCDVVARRAARLAAAGIVGILKKIGRKTRAVVAVEGELYSDYVIFREYLHEAVGDILGDDVADDVVVQAMAGGSGIGAALLAAAPSGGSGVHLVDA